MPFSCLSFSVHSSFVGDLETDRQTKTEHACMLYIETYKSIKAN